MSLNLGSLKAELDAVVGEATNIVDLADKYAATVAKFAGFVPGVGSQAATIAKVIDDLDKALHQAKQILSAL